MQKFAGAGGAAIPQILISVGLARGMYTAARDPVNRNDHFQRSQKSIAARMTSARYFSPGARRHSTDFSIESFRV
jgi:hypothetical protein